MAFSHFKKSWFLAHIYSIKYQDHLIILSCAPILNYIILLNAVISFNFLLIFAFPRFSPFSPNNCFNNSLTMIWLHFSNFYSKDIFEPFQLFFFYYCYSHFMCDYSYRKYRSKYSPPMWRVLALCRQKLFMILVL